MSDPATAPDPSRPAPRPSPLPTVLVFLCLGALGVWGHVHGWRAPRFADLLGRDEAPAEDWCALHSVPQSRCVACQPELLGADPADWCREHGVPESQCEVCNPGLAAGGVPDDWCAEHGVPESGCTLCNPGLAHPGELPPDEGAVTVSAGTHDGEQPEAHPAGAPADATPSLRDARTCRKHALVVQFASAASVEKAGIALGQATLRPMSDSIVANAEVDYDRTRFARVASRVTGTAWRVDREPGAAVKAGDVLALVSSTEVGRARAELHLAAAADEAAAAEAARLAASSEAGFRTAADRLAAEAAARAAALRHAEARQVLATLGLDETPAADAAGSSPPGGAAAGGGGTAGTPPGGAGAGSRAAGDALPPDVAAVVAPFDGVVVSCDVVTGERVDPERTLFEVADTRRMRIEMDVPQSEAHRMALGQEVIFRPDDARDEVVTGTLTWISTAVDERARTVKVRADVANEGGGLLAHAFGRAQVVVRTDADAVAVPSAAIQWEGCCYVVFVRLADDLFQTRKVRLGARDAAWTEVLVGLGEGEVVATEGSHVLTSEILKSRLGAGCVDD
jgi:membrane fusion protein, heavy metal efflux system